MAATDVARRLGREIVEAVENLGDDIASAEEITRCPKPGSQRACFRVKFANGRSVKARRFVSAEKRESVTRLRAALDRLPFSRIIASYGAATIEEWIPGSPIDADNIGVEVIRDQATLLGRLHSRHVPDELHAGKIRDWTGYSDRLRKQVLALVEQRHISSMTIEALLDHAGEDPGQSLECGIIHTDFHPGNMVLNPAGEVWVVDNEDIRLGLFDYDIARCWIQWPMTEAQRDVFCTAYTDFRSLDTFFASQRFWSVCALVNSAYLRVQSRRPSQSALMQLDKISRRPDKIIWAEPS